MRSAPTAGSGWWSMPTSPTGGRPRTPWRGSSANWAGLYTVVNNAGLMHIGQVADALTEDWDQMLQINVQGLLYVTRAALPHLLRAADDSPRRVADLVNISSTAGRAARPG